MRRTNPVLAAEGAVLFIEKVSRALEHVDSSSGAIVTAVNRAIEELVSIIANAPVDLLFGLRALCDPNHYRGFDSASTDAVHADVVTAGTPAQGAISSGTSSHYQRRSLRLDGLEYYD
jgi:hypothetical protein